MHLHAGFFLFSFAIAALAAFGVTYTTTRLRRFGSHRRLWFTIGLVIIVVEFVPFILFTWIVNPQQPTQPKWLFPETPLISTLRAHQGEYHILPIYLHTRSGAWMPPMLVGKVSVDFDLRSGSGYEELLPTWTATLWRTVEGGGMLPELVPRVYNPSFSHDQLPIALLEKLSVGLLAGAPNISPRDTNGSEPIATGALQLIYRGPDGSVYKVVHALPRAFLVPRVVATPDEHSALSMLANPNFDARKAAILIGEDTAAKTNLTQGDSSFDEGEATAVIVRDRLNNVEVEVDTHRPAMLVLNDSWDSGWKADVDGVQQPVLRVNYAFRGVVMPEGKHHVTFSYRPTALLIGLAISSGTLALLMVWFTCIGLRVLRRLPLK